MSHARDDCIFCHIVAGSAPCHKVYEDDASIAFMDIFPATDGHVLVVPRQHHECVFDIPPMAMAGCAEAVRRVADAIRAELQPDGMSIVQANGEAAGQTVMHYHVHLVPRTSGQKMRLHGSQRGDPDRLAVLAAAIGARLR